LDALETMAALPKYQVAYHREQLDVLDDLGLARFLYHHRDRRERLDALVRRQSRVT
jgi:hypothetical protein